MSYLAMQVIYHSCICPEKLKKELLRVMTIRGYVGPNKKLGRPHYFPALSGVDEAKFIRTIGSTPYAKLVKSGIGRTN
jgi:hypothetical protein